MLIIIKKTQCGLHVHAGGLSGSAISFKRKTNQPTEKQTTLNSKRSRGEKQHLLTERMEINMKLKAQKAALVLHLQLCQFRNTSIPEGRMKCLQQACSRVVPNKDLRRVGCVLHHQLCMFALQTLQEFRFLEGNDSWPVKSAQ